MFYSKKITVFIIGLTMNFIFVYCLLAQEKNISNEPALKRKMTSFIAKNETIRNILCRLESLHERQFVFCIEDFWHQNKMFFNTKITLKVENKSTEDILNILAEEKNLLKWIKGKENVYINIVNIVAISLKDKNPFDKTVENLDFKANASSFVFKINEAVPELMGVNFGIGGKLNNKMVSIVIKSKQTVRQVFNEFSRKQKFTWSALIRDKPRYVGNGPGRYGRGKVFVTFQKKRNGASTSK